ncbi:MAG: CidA/LrgA family protein [Lachnospiraceae bacterium]|nr:CidA/LrgA family protein [Lachnospiraceae bacterium]
MKYIKQFIIILAISFAGELLHSVIPAPIPASIYGLVLMFLLLFTKILKVEAVKETSAFLIEIMPLVFIPAAVGLVNSWELISGKWYMYVTVIIVTTVLVMAVSGLVTQLVIRLGKKNKNGSSKE